MEPLGQPWELLIQPFSTLMFQSQLESLFQLTDRIASEENTEQTQPIFKLNMYASLLGCEVEIIDKIINQQPISLGSNRVLQE